MSDNLIPTTDLTTALATFGEAYREHGESSLRTLCERGDTLCATLTPIVDTLRTSWLAANGARKPQGFNLEAFVATANANGANLTVASRSLSFGFTLATCDHSEKALAAFMLATVDEPVTIGPDSYETFLIRDWATKHVTASGRRSKLGNEADQAAATASAASAAKSAANKAAATILIDPDSNRTDEVVKGLQPNSVEAIVAMATAKHDFEVRYNAARKALTNDQRKQADKLIAAAKAKAVRDQTAKAKAAAKALKVVS